MRKALMGLAVLGLCMATAASAAPKDKQGDVNVGIRGGVGGFVGDLNGYSAAGPTWGAAVNLQPWNVVGIEIGYEGSRNMITDPRVENVALTRYGGSALLKLAPPFIERVKPYVGVGLGASYVNVTGNADGLYKNDIMEEVPMAAGLEFNSGAVTAGLRATYRMLIDEGFADQAQPVGNPEGGLLDFGATLGGRF
jgi:opacity protein-like surface antigen